jgi:hypothetical protein
MTQNQKLAVLVVPEGPRSSLWLLACPTENVQPLQRKQPGKTLPGRDTRHPDCYACFLPR